MSAGRPIVFSGPRVQQIRAGDKRQTRRILAALPGLGKVTEFGVSDTSGYAWHFRDRAGRWHDLTHAELLALCPYGCPGTRLWVKEAFLPDPSADDEAWDALPAGYLGWDDRRRTSEIPAALRRADHVLYAASWEGSPLRWQPARYMPRWASRLTLDVTAVHVQRLQDLSEADARAEGVLDPELRAAGGSAVRAFSTQWEQLHGPGSWDANPYVWAVEFRQVSA